MSTEKRGPNTVEEDSLEHPLRSSTAAQGEFYEIRIDGYLGDHWSAWFDGLSLTQEQDGTTVLVGLVRDQAELHGILDKIRDLGLPLVSVNHVEPDSEEAPGK